MNFAIKFKKKKKKREGDLGESPEMQDLDYISFNFGTIEGGLCPSPDHHKLARCGLGGGQKQAYVV